MNAEPQLSVVVVTPGRFASLRRTVQALQQQTARQVIELIVVAPSEGAVSDRGSADTDGFQSVRVLPIGAIENVDHAAAVGLQAANAPIVGSIEDHAFPEPDWAFHLLRAWSDRWAAVGSAIENANPERALSWANMLIAYGQWMPPGRPGETGWVPSHNITVRRDLMRDFGPALAQKMGREGQFLRELQAAGHRFAFEPKARIRHVNPSTLEATARLRFDAGRLYGASRAQVERWGTFKRIAYTLGSPLIPVLRWHRLRGDLAARGVNVPMRVQPAFILALCFDACGQAAGYLTDAGTASERLAVFEMDRAQHVAPSERGLLFA